MNAFLRKEILEYVRTWRFWLIMGPVTFFAVTGPLLALYMPEILGAALGTSPDVTISIPDPTWPDSYIQWTSNLTQIVALLVIVVAASTIAGECASGTAIPVLTSGLPRRDFVLAKTIVHMVAAVLAVWFGTVLTWIISLIVFPETQFSSALDIMLFGSLLFVFLTSVSILSSTLMRDALGAVGVAVAVFFLMAGLGIWAPAQKYSPAGLIPGISNIAANQPTNLFWTSVMTCVFVIILISLAVTLFERREI